MATKRITLICLSVVFLCTFSQFSTACWHTFKAQTTRELTSTLSVCYCGRLMNIRGVSVHRNIWPSVFNSLSLYLDIQIFKLVRSEKNKVCFEPGNRSKISSQTAANSLINFKWRPDYYCTVEGIKHSASRQIKSWMHLFSIQCAQGLCKTTASVFFFFFFWLKCLNNLNRSSMLMFSWINLITVLLFHYYVLLFPVLPLTVSVAATPRAILNGLMFFRGFYSLTGMRI